MEKQNLFWATNLKMLRQRKKLSQEELAQQLGITRPKLNAHENGQTVNPTAIDLVNFSTFFEISVDTLLKVDLRTVSELKIRELEAGNDAFITGTSLRILATTVDKRNRENAEFVPVKAKAGYSSGYADPEYIADLPQFSLPQLQRDKKYRMFPTTGDSMHPYPENCLVIASYVEDWSGIKDGTDCIVVLRNTGDDIVFKQVENRIKTDRRLVLKSLNEHYRPYEVAVSDVLEVWKFESFVGNERPAGNITLVQIAQSLRDINVKVSAL